MLWKHNFYLFEAAKVAESAGVEALLADHVNRLVVLVGRESLGPVVGSCGTVLRTVNVHFVLQIHIQCVFIRESEI